MANFRELQGKGVVGEVGGREVFVGRPGATVCEDSPTLDGNVAVCVDGELVGRFDVEDDLRRDAAEFVARLRAMGMRVVVLSGDRGDRVRALAERLGIREYYAETSPERKVEVIKELKGRGGVAMLGDGVNDAAALALADVSVAMGNAVDLSKNAAHIVLLNNDLKGLLSILERRGTLSKAVPSNVALALLYNAVGIPLAVLGTLSGMLAMVVMVLSLASVFANARLSALYA
ncbi:hypothetical protein HS1genome_1755 [Sulfodiicoccus acidiphilus]|uniref:HAD family hydrolase n=1 Tax=Sulfodiicoccus acidiphilus TaxID=1670455 RepID=A0A348B5B4_9CREN|nr:HAD-IC family P-type ATPase [Sulfodiicoccus acidiphilus]BBD73366.1 hypothetical protein HS1genome_1755 [Sulfodiicoccus acidiphilus]GGU00953.1 hypothetical protein GCM10007116_17740 [Sulfodiicoccus acidiphilus]